MTDYPTTPITVRFNGETRTIDAYRFSFSYGAPRPDQFCIRAKMTTSHGKMSHVGSVRFVARDEGYVYTDRDIVDASYPGMKGNDRAWRKSKLRWIGFAD